MTESASDPASEPETTPALAVPTAKALYEAYAPAMVALLTTDEHGDERTASAFHVGDGSFVTARHCLDDAKSVRIYLGSYILLRLAPDSLNALGAEIVQELRNGNRKVFPLAHPDPRRDVAVFSVPELAPLPAIPLGDHLDDWIVDTEFVLTNVLVLGFPPIPLSSRPLLVAAQGQVNAVADLINVPHVHFIVSVPPKGGFSGGAVISEWGVGLGVITCSLVRDHAPEELGYLTVLTVEPILECLGHHRLLPAALAELWDGQFTSESRYYGKPEEAWAQAWLEYDRDGHRTRLQFASPCPDTNAAAVQEIAEALGPVPFEHEVVHAEVEEFRLTGPYEQMEEPLMTAVSIVDRHFIGRGFLPVERPGLIHRSLKRQATVGENLGDVAVVGARDIMHPDAP